MAKIQLKQPTIKYVSSYLANKSLNGQFFGAEPALELLFKKFPNNVQLEEVLLKVTCLNDLYNTNVYATYEMAKHIFKLNIDSRLIAGDKSLVPEIAYLKHADRHFYSFATKYCNWHYQNKFPIYDQYVDKILWEYSKTYEFSSFKRKDLKEYGKFYVVINDFVKFFNLKTLTLKQVDKFLWLYGMQKFK